MNAIRGQRLHQAYLFTGSRGIGKTSIARIFAKVIRCEQAVLQSSSGGDWYVSCDQCASCKEIAGGTSVDVIEIDGASNNGVEAVREIRENAKYLPSTGTRKIYIIDEVHMLTTAAFNALLKTLEEPPAHVIFVFATTEPHKIPATILSRCQRFDFRRGTLSQIQTMIGEIAKSEGIDAEPAALALVARAAEGSMRDSLSLLDQVIAFSGTHVTVQSVRESVGLIEGQTLLGIVEAVFARKPLDALAAVEQAYQRGHDLRVLTRSLIEFIHGAVLAKIGAPGSATLELAEDEWKELQRVASLRPLEEIELIFQVLHHGLEWIARSPQPKVVLDVLLVKCATAEALGYADAVSAAPAAQPAAAPSAAPVPAAPSRAMSAAPAVTPNAVTRPATVAASASVAAAAPVTAPVPAAVAVAAKAPPSWEGFIAHVRLASASVASQLEYGVCKEFPKGDSDSLVIGFPPEVNAALVRRDVLSTAARDYFGRPIRAQVLAGAGSQDTESMALRKQRQQREREQAAQQAVRNHPIIQEARSLFGGELGPIEVSGDDHDDA
jgi:DNA polymerase-3 subunit gamma/tau